MGEREVTEAQVLTCLRSTRDLGIGADALMRGTAAKLLRDYDNGRALRKNAQLLPDFGFVWRGGRYYELAAPEATDG